MQNNLEDCVQQNENLAPYVAKLNLTLIKIYSLLTVVNRKNFFDADELTLQNYFAIIEDLTNDALLLNEHIVDILQC